MQEIPVPLSPSLLLPDAHIESGLLPSVGVRGHDCRKLKKIV